MNISMPVLQSVPSPHKLRECKLYLARYKEDGRVFTVILAREKEVLFIDQDSICQGTLDYFYKEYEIVREYINGETLSITV